MSSKRLSLVLAVPVAGLILFSAACSGGSLALLVDVQRRVGNGPFDKVPPTTTFNTGEQFRLAIQAKSAGHLYLFNVGPSGNTSKLFPVRGMESAFPAGRDVLVPNEKGGFQFGAPAGSERVIIIFSKDPQPALEGSSGDAAAALASVRATASASGGTITKEEKGTSMLIRARKTSILVYELSLAHGEAAPAPANG